VETEASSADFDIHFGTQKEPLFLIDRPERDAALFFASSSDTRLLMEMQQLHKKRVKEAKRARTELSDAIARHERELAALAPTAEIDATLATLDERFELLRAAEKELARLRSVRSELRRREAERDRHRRRHGALSALEAPPALVDEEPLQSLIRRLARLRAQKKMLAARDTAFGALQPPPTLEDPAPLAATVRRLRELRRAARQRADELDRAEQRLAASAAAIEDFVDANPTCPTCGGALDPARLIERGHAHD